MQYKRMLCGVVAALGLATIGNAAQSWFEWGHPGIRGLVQHTQDDLNRASSFEHGPGQQDRYLHAQDALSNFDRELSRGRFDKGRLNKAISSIDHVLDHNTLDPGTRDALRRDEENLRVARERHEH